VLHKIAWRIGCAQSRFIAYILAIVREATAMQLVRERHTVFFQGDVAVGLLNAGVPGTDAQRMLFFTGMRK